MESLIMPEAKRKNKTNPLYVVTNKGQDVEQASNVIDLWVKKLGLRPVIELLDYLLKSLTSLVSNYAMFMAVKNILDGYLEQIQFFLSKLGLVAVVPYPTNSTT
jgi:hypothetical protein